ncbi:MAG: prolyl oligopeptidase family serine peptidase [Parasporobacterium sp.]|nr:prolyl oligopeptidase family serine peptidase [Parasporobacterium sp.]
MINLKCEFQSFILATRVEVDVFLPNIVVFTDEIKDFKEYYTFQPFKTLYLLHGAWDSGKQWVENTSALRLAEEANLALVIPSVGNTFYANTLYGVKYEDYFMQEVIGFVQGLFPLSDKREDNFIAGVSMGGYGALKTVFKDTSLFSKAAVMSAVVDISYSARIIRTIGVETDHTIGKWKELKGSEYDLIPMLDALEGKYETIPELLLICGTEDYLREINEEFHLLLDQKGVRNTYRDYPGFHDWKFWDEHLKECIDFFVKE